MSIEFLHRCQILRVQISDSPDEPGGFCCFFVVFLWMGAKLLLMCFFCFPGEHLVFHVHVTRQSEILRDDSWRFTSGSGSIWSLHQFRSFLVCWSMSLSVEKFFARRTRVCGLIMPGQGEFYIMVFHWCSVQPTFHVSQRYRRADIRITFTVSASLPMMRSTV